jgi:hypothetical protein
MTEPTAGFATEITVFRDFSQVIDDSVYRPMPEARDIAADALPRAARWVEEEIDLSLRAAMVPVIDFRASGNDVLVARYGLYEQDAVIMTCIVPSIETDDHLHFLDGADGGYALAARMMDPGKCKIRIR